MSELTLESLARRGDGVERRLNEKNQPPSKIGGWPQAGSPGAGKGMNYCDPFDSALPLIRL